MIFKDRGINTPKDLMRFLEGNLQYGFTYKNKIFTEDNPNFDNEFNKHYKLRLGEDFIKSGYGVCWDFCEFERLFFIEQGIEHECYYLESFISREEGGPTHTFALFKQKDKWYWFEYSWYMFRGIHEYRSKEEALTDILDKYYHHNAGISNNIDVYKINQITKRLDAYEFVEYCEHQEKLEI